MDVLTGADAILWSQPKHAPFVPSPLLTDGFLCVISGNDMDAGWGACPRQGVREMASRLSAVS
ncbi:MAG: hypothetical protein ABSF38_18330 [Verrucomicrobiota bacterium]|jgi:hypothetical protein